MKGPLIRLNSKLPDSVLCLCLSVLGFLALWSLLMILQPISAADCILMWLRGSCLPMCRNTFVLIRQNAMWYFSKKTLHTRFITGKTKQKTLKLDAEILSSTCFLCLKMKVKWNSQTNRKWNMFQLRLELTSQTKMAKSIVWYLVEWIERWHSYILKSDLFWYSKNKVMKLSWSLDFISTYDTVQVLSLYLHAI